VGFFSQEKAQALKEYLQYKNPQQYVMANFQKQVINDEAFKQSIDRIAEFSKLRINDYYQSAIKITASEINNQLKNINLQYPNKKIIIDQKTLPFEYYTSQILWNTTNTGGKLATEIAVVVIGKSVGAKAGAIASSKIVSITGSKLVVAASSKVASVFSFVLAPVVDYLFNEGVKHYQYEDTKEKFGSVIIEVVENYQDDLYYQIEKDCLDVRNKAIAEINKKIKLTIKD
jgi:hypothetical protein